MKRVLIFDQVYVDAVKLSSQKRISFFENHTPTNLDSITQLSEDEILNWLVNNDHFKELFIDRLMPEQYILNLGVSAPFTSANKKPGDIDLMLIDPNLPHQTVVFECKKLKSQIDEKGNYKVNNTSNIRKGITQVNSYTELGFHLNYLMMIILDDGSNSNTPNTIMKSSSDNEKIEEIYDIPYNDRLHEDVGVVYVRITQQTGKSFNLQNGIGVCFDKRAKPREQRTQTTNKVKEIINRAKEEKEH